MRISFFLFLLLGAGLLWGAAELTLDDGATPPAKTTILSETLEMVSSPTENLFYFSKNVRVTATNLRMLADQIIVTAKRSGEQQTEKLKELSSGIKTPGGPIGTIQKIVATGAVKIQQDGREATAGRAEFFPKDGKVVLTDNPRVVDARAIVSGWRITLIQGERRVIVEQDPKGTSRPSVNLESMPNLGFDSKKTPAEPLEAAKPVENPAATGESEMKAPATPSINPSN